MVIPSSVLAKPCPSPHCWGLFWLIPRSLAEQQTSQAYPSSPDIKGKVVWPCHALGKKGSAQEFFWQDCRPAMLTVVTTGILWQETEQCIGDPLEELLAGRVRSVEYSGGQVIVDAPRRGRVYLPGSFNPLHEGHRCGIYSSGACLCNCICRWCFALSQRIMADLAGACLGACLAGAKVFML